MRVEGFRGTRVERGDNCGGARVQSNNDGKTAMNVVYEEME